jgi:hypothetical protein
MKICPAGAELFHPDKPNGQMDKQTDMKLIVDFCSFVNMARKR